jgi:thioredoxin reductase (NADPH)
MLDLVVIGAGPAGLAVSVAARERALDHLVLERGPLAATIARFPEGMIFHSTAANLEIGGIPFVSPNPKPTKLEALQYYRRVVQALDLPVRTFTEVTTVEGAAPAFRLHTRDLHGHQGTVEARAIVAASGAQDVPRMLGVPGEDLPHVSHEYGGPHRAFGKKVLVVGGRNSACEVALDLWRAGTDVTMSYRRGEFNARSVKYWILPDLENRIREGSIPAIMPSEVEAILPGTVKLRTPDGPVEVEADFVYLLTGFAADTTLLRTLGVEIAGDGAPVHDEQTRETTVSGVYLAGRVCAGDDGNRIFIENGREHGAVIVEGLDDRS